MTQNYAKDLADFLTREFNIKRWGEGDRLNNSKVIGWGLYYSAATTGGREEVLSQARNVLEKLGAEMEEPGLSEIEKVRNIGRAMAQAAIKYSCH